MAKQLHKRFPDKQVKSLLQRYLSKEIKLNYIHRYPRLYRRGASAEYKLSLSC